MASLPLGLEDLGPDFRPHLTTQQYAATPRIEGVRVVDMSTSHSWAEFAESSYARIVWGARAGQAELKALVPFEAKDASCHGIRARRSKAGAISFEVLAGGGADGGEGGAHAPVQ